MLLLLLLGAHAAEPLTLARLAEATKPVRALRLPFTQERHLAILDEPVTTTGVVELDRDAAGGGALRWEFTGSATLLLREGRVRRFDASGREENLGDGAAGTAALRAQMQALLGGDWSALERLFTIAADADGTPRLTCTPREGDLARIIRRLEIRFRADLSAPEELILHTGPDDRTIYRFAAPVAGAIDPARFARP